MIDQAHRVSTLDTSMNSSARSLQEVNIALAASVDKVKAAAAIVSKEEQEAQAAGDKFSQLNSQFQEKIELLGRLITDIEANHGSMITRVQELEKVQLELDATKQTLQSLMTRMEALTSTFSKKFEAIDEAMQASSL